MYICDYNIFKPLKILGLPKYENFTSWCMLDFNQIWSINESKTTGKSDWKEISTKANWNMQIKTCDYAIIG